MPFNMMLYGTAVNPGTLLDTERPHIEFDTYA